MRPFITTALVFSTLFVSGCDDQARSFAGKTKSILANRSVEISKKIRAESQAYQAYRAQASEDTRNLANDSLANERSERVDQLAADYLDDPSSISHWRSELFDYAQTDYTTTMRVLSSDLTATNLYMQRYQELKIEQEKVRALSKLLTVLAQKQSLQKELGGLSDFADETQKNFDQKICADLKAKSNAGQKAASKLYSDKKCESSK